MVVEEEHPSVIHPAIKTHGDESGARTPASGRSARGTGLLEGSGGSVGVSALGALLSHQVAGTVSAGLARLGIPADATGDSHSIPDLSALPAPVRQLFEHAFGSATGHLFLVAVPFAVVALGCLLFIREVPLRETILHDDELNPEVVAELGIDQPGGVR